MVGINVPIPVPVPTTRSAAGRRALRRHHIHGPEGINFYTRGKVVTSRWPDPATRRSTWASANAQEPNGGGWGRRRCCSSARRPRARRPGRRHGAEPVRTCAERIEAGDAPIPFPRPRSGASSPGRSPSPGTSARLPRSARARRGRPLLGQGRRARPRRPAGPLRARPAPRDARPPLRARRRRRAGRPNRAVRPGDARLLLRRGRAGDRVQRRLRRHPAGLLPARRRRPRRRHRVRLSLGPALPLGARKPRRRWRSRATRALDDPRLLEPGGRHAAATASLGPPRGWKPPSLGEASGRSGPRCPRAESLRARHACVALPRADPVLGAWNVGLDEEARHGRTSETGAEEPARPAPPPPLALSRQKPQFGAGASSSPRNAPPTGAMITVMSLAGTLVSFRAM